MCFFFDFKGFQWVQDHLGGALGVLEHPVEVSLGVPEHPVEVSLGVQEVPGDPHGDPWGPPRALLGTSCVSLEALLGTLGDLPETSWAPWDPVGVSLGVSLGVQEVKNHEKPMVFDGFW